MGRDPAFLFYSSDFLTGVAGLTMEERGQYITLMCLQHQTGHLSGKTIRLSLGFDLVSSNSDVLGKFTIDEEGNYFNKRLDDEIQKRFKTAEAHRTVGKLGGRPIKNAGKEEITEEPNTNHMDNLLGSLIEDVNENDNVIESKSKGKDSITETKNRKHKYGEYKNVLLTDEELEKLKGKFSDYAAKIENFSEGVELKGYVYKNHYLAILKWAGNENGKQTYEAKLIQSSTGGGFQM